MKSLLVLDTDPDRIRQLGLLLRLARYPFHVVWSAEEACNHVATHEESLERYLCLLINNADTPEKAEATLHALRHHDFPLCTLLVERYPRGLTNHPPAATQVNVLRCCPEAISEILTTLSEHPCSRRTFSTTSP